MATLYRHTTLGTLHRPGAVVSGVQTHERMSPDAWAALGCEPYTPPAAPEPTLTELRAAAMARYQAEAAECLRANLPAPWDVLRSVATPEFQAWADSFCELVAAELSRLEAAVAAAGSAEDLAALVADWPEVEP